VLGRLGGAVAERIYPGMGHDINDDEVKHVRGLLANLAKLEWQDRPGTRSGGSDDQG
jgi:hypothetical protein